MTPEFDLRFLVVDDLAIVRRVIRSLLREIGYASVEEAEDGVVALDMLRNARFDFVISDIAMPRMNGFELLAAIKQDETLARLPVLMVSAEARHEDIVRAAQEGAAGHVVKPFSKATLEAKVAKIMQRPALA
jgi:two-component system, chemotaxis family, chemotaxis protein CheY